MRCGSPDGDPTSDGVRDREELSEIAWVRVDAGYCEAAIDAARQINRRDHRRLPGAWEFWRDTFEGAHLVQKPALDDRAIATGRLRDRLPETETLIEVEGFQSWLIQVADLAPYLSTALRGRAQQPRERAEQCEQAVSICLVNTIKARQRRLWRSRLMRQAALWQQNGDSAVSELCLAAAWGLDDRNGVPSEDHPLLRAMTRARLEIAMGL